MATQREQDAADYLKKHKIIELMDNLISMIFFYRPDNPRAFLIEQLEQIKNSQQNAVKGPNLFNNSNLDTIFGIMDPSNRRYITFAQYKQVNHKLEDAISGDDRMRKDKLKWHLPASDWLKTPDPALITLGIKNINECPEGANEDRISHDTFKTEAMQGLQTCSATYEQPHA